jgi:hypothetical protein
MYKGERERERENERELRLRVESSTIAKLSGGLS